MTIGWCSTRNYFLFIVFFTLLGSGCVKALQKMLIKLTPAVDFINVFCTNTLVQKIRNKMLMKWTPGWCYQGFNFRWLTDFGWTTQSTPSTRPLYEQCTSTTLRLQFITKNIEHSDSEVRLYGKQGWPTFFCSRAKF